MQDDQLTNFVFFLSENDSKYYVEVKIPKTPNVIISFSNLQIKTIQSILYKLSQKNTSALFHYHCPKCNYDYDNDRSIQDKCPICLHLIPNFKPDNKIYDNNIKVTFTSKIYDENQKVIELLQPIVETCLQYHIKMIYN